MELPAVRRSQPITKKANISSTAHVQLLQWLHGKQQQQQLKYVEKYTLTVHILELNT